MNCAAILSFVGTRIYVPCCSLGSTHAGLRRSSPTVVTTVDHSKRPKPPHMPNSPVTCAAKVSVLEDVLLEGKVTDCEISDLVPASGAGALVITLDVLPPSLPYNPSRCDHDCPLCERQFLVGAACRKSLAKHVRDKHEPNLNPNHPRFLVWMEASERSWCLDCGFSYSRRCLHKCKGPRATPEVSSPSLVCPPVADSEVKVEGTCVLPGLWRLLPHPSLLSNGFHNNVGCS